MAPVTRGSWTIDCPGFCARAARASSATTYSPSTNVPAASNRKQRSKSPSKATPKSAPASATARAVAARISGRRGFGTPSGKVGSGLPRTVTASTSAPRDCNSRAKLGAWGPRRHCRSRTGCAARPLPLGLQCLRGARRRPRAAGRPQPRARQRCRRGEVAGGGEVAYALEFLIRERPRAGADELEAVVVEGVVRGGHHEPEAQFADPAAK